VHLVGRSEVLTKNLHAAGVGWGNAKDHACNPRPTGPCLTYEAQSCTFWDVQRHIVNRSMSPKSLRQASNFDRSVIGGHTGIWTGLTVGLPGAALGGFGQGNKARSTAGHSIQKLLCVGMGWV